MLLSYLPITEQQIEDRMARKSLIWTIMAALLLSACTVTDVVTAPVKVVSKAVDVLTVSQEEADQKRGKRLREHEERLGKLERERAKQQAKCQKGDEGACRKVQGIEAEIADEQARPI